MRISDWSSDVCSSDLRQPLGHQPGADLVETIEQSEPQERRRVVQRPPPERCELRFQRMAGLVREEAGRMQPPSLRRAKAIEAGPHFLRIARSEERRVGKERVRTCRSRWAPYPK